MSNFEEDDWIQSKKDAELGIDNYIRIHKIENNRVILYDVDNNRIYDRAISIIFEKLKENFLNITIK